MRIRFFALVFTLLSVCSFGQSGLQTQNLMVTGKVKRERSFTLAQLKSFPTRDLGDVNTSCSSKQRENAKQVKAILLKDVLDSVRFHYESPKMLNRFYFSFEAADGYKVVYSFNEIYNTDTGNHLFIVVEKDGFPIEKLDNSILLLTTSDIRSGTRNIKNLSRIVVHMAD